MKDEILKLRKEGKSYNEIKEILKCSKGTISYHCSKLDSNKNLKETNLEIKNKKQKKDDSFLLPDEDTIDKIVSLRKMKKTFEEISNDLEISIDKISKVCRKLGLVYLDRLDDKDEIIKKIIERYLVLRSTRKVSVEFGISRATITKYVKSHIKHSTKEERKKNVSKAVVEWRVRTKQKLVDYKGGECCRCGYKKETKALTFHHLNPEEKDFTIGGKSWSFERLKKEVDKCILVCSNCHIEIHEEIRNEGDKALR